MFGLGFRSVNVGKTRISGLEFTFNVECWTNIVFELFRTEINYNNYSVKLTAIETQVLFRDMTI